MGVTVTLNLEHSGERKEYSPLSPAPVLDRLVEPYYNEDGITIYLGDNRRILPLLGDFDLLLTDPPYGLGDKCHKRNGTGWATAPKGSSRLWCGVTPEWDKQLVPQEVIDLSITKCNRSIIWGGNYYAMKPTRAWLVWNKIAKVTMAHAELAWTNLDMPVRVFDMATIDAYQNKAETQKSHPTEKPLPLMGWCLNLAGEVQTVLDPWMGTGATLVAAKARGMKAVGIEINELYIKSAISRLSQGVLWRSNAPKLSHEARQKANE